MQGYLRYNPVGIVGSGMILKTNILWRGFMAAAVAVPLLGQIPAPKPTTTTGVNEPTSIVDRKEASASGALVDPSTYVIGPLDTIRVTTWREPDFSCDCQVRPDEKITMNLIGDVDTKGKTPDDLRIEIAKRVSKYVANPQVQVQVMQVKSKRFFLVGKFNKTGEVPIERPITVMEAIAGAGGFQQFTNQSKVIILRGTNKIRFNYKEVLKGKKMEQNIYLQNGDYVIAN